VSAMTNNNRCGERHGIFAWVVEFVAVSSGQPRNAHSRACPVFIGHPPWSVAFRCGYIVRHPRWTVAAVAPSIGCVTAESIGIVSCHRCVHHIDVGTAPASRTASASAISKVFV
jgi:hypothetical protein